MKIIHLIRHAKSDWGSENLSDKDRPLNKRGKKSCRIMAGRIVEVGGVFENVFCSSAKRAQETIKRISENAAQGEFEWNVCEELYTFDSRTVLAWLQKVSDSYENVMVVGHNPGLTELCNFAGDKHIDNISTCGYVQLCCDINSWKELASNKAELKAYIFPKMFDEFYE